MEAIMYMKQRFQKYFANNVLKTNTKRTTCTWGKYDHNLIKYE